MRLVALVFLLSAFSSLTLSHVVNSFKKICPSFFIRNPENRDDIIIPTIFRGRQYKKICQRWKNKYRFATVYDTEKRIPVYSAYTFLNNTTNERDSWKIEPQLEDFKEYKRKIEMIDSPRNETTVNEIKNQAVDLDYRSGLHLSYTRGHVFPKAYAADQDQADSTFTLTNIAPQTEHSNGQWAEKVETPMLEEIRNICRLDQNHLAYIVTGVVPGNTSIRITRHQIEIENGINVPSHFWSAFCCTDNTDANKLACGAYLAKLDNFKSRKHSIVKLSELLTELYKQYFNVFPRIIS